MLRTPPFRRIRAAQLAVAMMLASAPAHAQGTDTATVKLIQLLIEKGILSKDQAASLLSQAQSEARASHAPVRAARAAQAGAASLATAEPPAPELPKGTVRVTYVPPAVRDQIAAQVRDQVLGEEQKHGWAAPNEMPEWTKRITVYGDIRLRGERDIQDPANKTDTTVGNPPVAVPFPFTDFNTLNSGSPFDAANPNLTVPTLNSTEDRTRFRVRARLGVKAEVTDWLTTDIRLASGNDGSPVSENQTLGQGGNFSKYSVWIDRAYALLKVPDSAKYDPRASLKAYIGRFANPFWTSDLEYSADLNFDGAAMQAVAPVTSNLSAWFSGGGFQVYNTDFNYANQLNSFNGKFPSRNKYMFGTQAGVDWQAAPAIATKFAVGMFNYQKVQGQLSSPCLIVNVATDVCNTDNSRPQFAQFGNTYFPIRNIAQVVGQSATEVGNTSAFADPQFYGLASRFNVLDLHGRVTLTRYDPVDVEIEAEYSKNLAFNRKDIINKGPVNNFNGGTSGVPGQFGGGDTAWMVKLEVGKPEITKLNEWNVYIEYKHLDTDSVLDAFTDSDFHLGGTNAKGFVVGADYGLGKNTYLAARWYSANTVTGPSYRNDVVQVDLNSKF